MQETITSESLFCDYYAQWVKTYKEGAIRDVTMGKYRLTQSWLGKLIPELRLTDMDRTAYQQLINGYAQHHERQTTWIFTIRSKAPFSMPLTKDSYPVIQRVKSSSKASSHALRK